jgi:hypothetical protein
MQRHVFVGLGRMLIDSERGSDKKKATPDTLEFKFWMSLFVLPATLWPTGATV